MYRLPPISDIGHVLDAAIQIDGAVGGCLQVVEDEGRAIRVLVERGLNAEYFERYRIVRSGFRTSCAQAFTERRRVVIRDVRVDPAYEELREAAAAAGYCSVQTTPLIDQDSAFHGLFSTYYDRPHHPGPESLREIDRCARVAMLVLQAHALRDAVAAADGRLGIHGRALPRSGAQAAEAAARVLAADASSNRKLMVDTATSNLEVVVGALRNLLKQNYSSAAAQPVIQAATA